MNKFEVRLPPARLGKRDFVLTASPGALMPYFVQRTGCAYCGQVFRGNARTCEGCGAPRIVSTR